jgi:hypothetical protein
MRTQKQIAASRENGRKSDGATTPEGKARIVNANLQSGIFAATKFLIWEHQGELQDQYYARHPPATQTPETQLQILGSLRKNESAGPPAAKTLSAPVLEHSSFSESTQGTQ